MSRILEFLDMGGYAVYVWPAYALAGLVLVALSVSSLRSLRAGQRELKRLEAEMPPRRKANQAVSDEGPTAKNEAAS